MVLRVNIFDIGIFLTSYHCLNFGHQRLDKFSIFAYRFRVRIAVLVEVVIQNFVNSDNIFITGF